MTVAGSAYQSAYDQVIRLMAVSLTLSPAIEPYRLAKCVDRWREQRIADVCINEFGDEARAEARRLLQVAEAAGRSAICPPAHSALMTDRCDGGCGFGKQSPDGARHAA